MPELPERKVGIVSCSGEELPEGTVARLAALKVLNQLRPRDTVTICLPLFLAGGVGDRAFARLHPTITVDGCELRFAARATEKYSNQPAASLVVNEIVSQKGLAKPERCRRLNAAGREAVSVVAEQMVSLVDQVLGKQARSPLSQPEEQAGGEAREATCSCGSGVPITKLVITGEVVEVLALPLIFQQFQQNGRGLDEKSKDELFETVKVYNSVPADLEPAYREAVLKEYARFCEKGKP